MGEIIISVEDEEKLELLKKFLESVEYVDSVEDFDSEITDKESSFDNFLELMNKVCIYDEKKLKFIKPKVIMTDYPDLLEHLSAGTTCRNNEVTYAKNIVKYLFGGEDKMPRNPEDIREYLSNDGKILLDYIKNNYISFYAIAHVLKGNKTKSWIVNVSDINEYIKDKLNDRNTDLDTVNEKNKLIKNAVFSRFFKKKTEEYRKQNR